MSLADCCALPLSFQLHAMTDFDPSVLPGEQSYRSRSSTWPLPPKADIDMNQMMMISLDQPKLNVPCAVIKHRSSHLLSPNDSSPLSFPIEPATVLAPDLTVLDNQKLQLVTITKKSAARKNAWGNLSYADLITKAIQSSPDGRLTLSQIYDWMVRNVPYFKDKGDSNSSAGWKNSIRHNLSLHNRFMRIQNEGTGKSSWWVINPDAKPGKSTRMRKGSDASKYERKRGRQKKRADADFCEDGFVTLPRLNCSPGSQDSLEDPQPWIDFRHRANSAASGGRLTPISDLPFGGSSYITTHPDPYALNSHHEAVVNHGYAAAVNSYDGYPQFCSQYDPMAYDQSLWVDRSYVQVPSTNPLAPVYDSRVKFSATPAYIYPQYEHQTPVEYPTQPSDLVHRSWVH